MGRKVKLRIIEQPLINRIRNQNSEFGWIVKTGRVLLDKVYPEKVFLVMLSPSLGFNNGYCLPIVIFFTNFLTISHLCLALFTVIILKIEWPDGCIMVLLRCLNLWKESKVSGLWISVWFLSKGTIWLAEGIGRVRLFTAIGSGCTAWSSAITFDFLETAVSGSLVSCGISNRESFRDLIWPKGLRLISKGGGLLEALKLTSLELSSWPGDSLRVNWVVFWLMTRLCDPDGAILNGGLLWTEASSSALSFLVLPVIRLETAVINFPREKKYILFFLGVRPGRILGFFFSFICKFTLNVI